MVGIAMIQMSGLLDRLGPISVAHSCSRTSKSTNAAWKSELVISDQSSGSTRGFGHPI